jgi:hypothetical protein
MSELCAVVDHRHDSIVFIDLGEPGRKNSARIEFMGASLTLPTGGPNHPLTDERSNARPDPGKRSLPGRQR